MNVLEINNLKLSFASYKGQIEVLHGIDLYIKSNERVALVGESGSGKSVIANTVAGLIGQKQAQISGQIKVLNRSLNFDNKLDKNVSMIFQDPSNAINPYFKIKKQLLEVALRGQFKTQKEALKAIEEILSLVNILDHQRVLASYPFELSGGLNQRIMIAMALINKNRLILADEPATALDVKVQALALDLMKDLSDRFKSSLLLISHNLAMLRNFAHRIYVIYKGTIVENGSTDTIFQDPRHPYTQTLLKAIPKISSKALPEQAVFSQDFLLPAILRDQNDKILSC